MGILDGLFGGGGSDPYAIYGDLFTPQQKAALQQREQGQGLLRMAGAFAKAGMPSRLPVPFGAVLGSAAEALGQGSDDNVQNAMRAMLYGAQAKKLQTEQQYLKDFSASQPEFMKTIAGILGTGAAPAAASPSAAPTAAPAGPLAAPAPAAAAPSGGGPLAVGAPVPLTPPALGAGEGASRPPASDASYDPSAGGDEVGSGGSAAAALLGPLAVGNARIGAPSSVANVKDEFAQRIQKLLADAPEDIRRKFEITSGFRSVQRNKDVYAALGLPPTNSRHSYGVAVDTTKDPDVLAYVGANGPKYGVGYTLAGMKGEENHLEMLSDAGGRLPIPGSPGGLLADGFSGGSTPPTTGGPLAAPAADPRAAQMQALMLAIAQRRAMAILGGIKDPYGPLMDAVTESPAFKGLVTGAQEGAKVPYARPLASEKAAGEQPYLLERDAKKAALDRINDLFKQGGLYDPEKGVIPLPGYGPLLEGNAAATARGTAGLDMTTTLRKGDDGYFYNVPISRRDLAAETSRAGPGVGLPAAPVPAPAGPVPGSTMMPGPALGGPGPGAAATAPGGFAPGAIVGKRELTPEQTGLSAYAQKTFEEQAAAAKQAQTGIAQANNVLDILQRGALVGPGSDLKVGFKRFAQLVNEAGIADLRGANDAELLANTEAFVSGMGNQMVGILKSFIPASNIDVKAAERIAGSKDMTLDGLRQIMGYIEKHGRKQIIDYNVNLDETLKRSPVPNAESLVIREPPKFGANIAVDPNSGAQMWERSPGKWVRF